MNFELIKVECVFPMMAFTASMPNSDYIIFWERTPL